MTRTETGNYLFIFVGLSYVLHIHCTQTEFKTNREPYSSMYISTYKVKRHFFRHGHRTAPKFCTHVRIETRLALT